MTGDYGRVARRRLPLVRVVMCLFPAALVLGGCSKHDTSLHNLSPQTVITGDCEDLKDACPAASVSCTSTTVTDCVNGAATSFTGFCHVSGGGLPCVAGKLTDDYKAFCKVESCFGTAEADCLAEGQASCQSCDLVGPIVKNCAGWSTSDEHDACGKLTPTQEGCIADILNDLALTGDQCVSWYEPRIMCLGEHIGLEGYASCAIEDCLGLTTLDECAQTYEILCSWTI